jgi:NADH dehydrogenase (ubiquinone) Fe-S protein 4
MSFLRPHSSLKLCRTFTQPSRPSRSQQLRCISQTRFRSLGEPNPRAIPDVDAMQATEDQASMIVAEMSPAAGPDEIDVYHPEHQPDYNARVDQATSSYSPVPKRVMDGSEPGETLAAAVLSGAPVDLQARQVRYAAGFPGRFPN